MIGYKYYILIGYYSLFRQKGLAFVYDYEYTYADSRGEQIMGSGKNHTGRVDTTVEHAQLWLNHGERPFMTATGFVYLPIPAQ